MEQIKYRPIVSLGMFDLFKGFAIILVVLSHSITSFDDVYSTFESNIGSVILYGLIISAGYGIRRNSNAICLRKIKKTFFKPYLITSIITAIFFFPVSFIRVPNIYYSFVDTFFVFLSFILGQCPGSRYFGYTVNLCGPIWFVVALAGSCILFNHILNNTKEKGTFISVVLCGLTGSLIADRVILPFCLIQAFSFVPGLYIGYLAKCKRLFERKLDSKIFVALFFSFVLLFVLSMNNLRIALYRQAFPLGPVAMLCVLVVAYGSVFLFTRLNRRENILFSFVEWIGHNSLYILCLHTIEFSNQYWLIIEKKLHCSPIGNYLIHFVLRVTFIAVGLLIIYYKKFTKINKKEECI